MQSRGDATVRFVTFEKSIPPGMYRSVKQNNLKYCLHSVGKAAYVPEKNRTGAPYSPPLLSPAI